jgi:hypothetical protein
MPDNGARSLHEFIVGNLFVMAMHSMGRIKSGSGLDIGSIEFNSIDYFLAWYPFVESSRSTDPD